MYFWNKPSTGWVNAGSNGTLTTNVAGLTLLGNALAATSNTLVVGAAFEGSGTGQVDVYVEPSGGWVSATQTALLTGSDSASGDAFGSSVAISGTTIAIGAPGATIGSNTGQGAVYAFTQPSGGWTNMTQTAKLTASDGAAGDALGNAVGTNGTTIYAGADSATVGANAAQGAVYQFNQTGGAWVTGTESAKISSSDGAASDQFGFSVAVAGPTLLVGAAAASVNGNLNQGAAYVFLQTSPPAVTTQPANATVASGGTATFTSAASGTPAPTVQWQVSTDGGATWNNDTTDAGNTTGTLTVAGATLVTPDAPVPRRVHQLGRDGDQQPRDPVGHERAGRHDAADEPDRERHPATPRSRRPPPASRRRPCSGRFGDGECPDDVHDTISGRDLDDADRVGDDGVAEREPVPRGVHEQRRHGDDDGRDADRPDGAGGHDAAGERRP